MVTPKTLSRSASSIPPRNRLCSRCSTSEREAPRLASWSPRPCMLCCEPRAHLRAHQGEGGGGDGIVIEFPGRASACTHCARDCDSARRRRVLTAPGAQLEASSRERLEPVDMPSSINCTTSECCLLWCAVRTQSESKPGARDRLEIFAPSVRALSELRTSS